MSIAQKIINFNNSLHLSDNTLPNGIRAMNPFKEEHASLITKITKEFYHKYYNDDDTRELILGINPGRLGAGITGVPFSDTK